MNEEELWKEWPRDPRIMVSNMGNVVSYKRGARRPLKASNNGQGYQQVAAGYRGSATYVHRMVADTWIPNPNNYPQVNHINGDKDDNSVENLEWTTRSQNLRHAWRTGLNKGRSTPIRIVETGEIFESMSECARRIGCHPSAIWHYFAGDQSTCRGYHLEYVED